MLSIKEILCPELRSFAPEERVRAWREAGATPFDALELFGMAAGLVAVTAFTRYAGSDLDPNARFAAGMINYIVALPLLVLALGPFLVRRLRRGLRAALKRSNTGTLEREA